MSILDSHLYYRQNKFEFLNGKGDILLLFTYTKYSWITLTVYYFFTNLWLWMKANQSRRDVGV